MIRRLRLCIAQLKYHYLRKWLIEEMIRSGWRQEPNQRGRLVKDEVVAYDTDPFDPRSTFRIDMADHEAVSRHFKEFTVR